MFGGKNISLLPSNRRYLGEQCNCLGLVRLTVLSIGNDDQPSLAIPLKVVQSFKRLSWHDKDLAGG